ncbi:MAG: hypothetical protein WC522_07675 [Candidatus Omnitrophota bacterium]
MEGVATDGVARLLLRMPTDASGSVTFSIEGGTGDSTEDGLLRSIDSSNGSNEGSSITVSTTTVSDKNYAFAIYQAPDSFVRTGCEAVDGAISERKLSITATFNGSTTKKTIKLVRPPLLLIHGLWAGPAMWGENNFRVNLGTSISGLRMFAVNYAKKNGNSFSDNSDVPYSCSGDNIQSIKKSFKSNRIAIAQVDVLGHSMGGLLARIFAGSDSYYNENNFGKGDIHKLITLDSPHYGSFLADLGIGCIKYPHTGWKLIKKGMLLERAEEKGYSFTKGALFDLMTTSYAIKTMNKTPATMASHAIAGYYAISSLDLIPACYSGIHKLLKSLDFDPSVYALTGKSDLVVSFNSQAGGFSSYTLDVFSHHHMAATADNVVDNMVELLNAPSNSELFGEGFPQKE